MQAERATWAIIVRNCLPNFQNTTIFHNNPENTLFLADMR